jgi:phosphonoacetate hydrolase
MFLVYVFDGLRPELVTRELMPNLWALRRSGTWFEHSHCVFPPVTRVNAASLATGSYPSVHGIPSNTLYLAGTDGVPAFRTTGDAKVLRGLRSQGDVPLLAVSTTAEALAAVGLRTLAISTGSPGSAYLLNPEASRLGGAVFHYSFSEPDELLTEAESRLGPHGGSSGVYTSGNLAERIRYASAATTEVLVPKLQPELVYFWSTIPDALHHRFGLGSPEAAAGLSLADRHFGDLVGGLKQYSGGNLNVIVTADHGYMTVEKHVDVSGELRLAGFEAAEDGGPAVTVDGGAAHIFTGDAGSSVVASLVEFLAEQEWASAIFAREPVPGALPLAAVDVDCTRAADVIACLAWRHGDNGRGVDGFSVGGGSIPVGSGDHGGGSPFEMRNTLLAAGPAFQTGVSTLPAGIVDVAPTVCCVLQVPAPNMWSGRVLHEALAGDPVPAAAPHYMESSSEPTQAGSVSTVSIASVAGTRYVRSTDCAR